MQQAALQVQLMTGSDPDVEAMRTAREIDAEVVFLSGVGMPTLDALRALEEDTGKPVISAASWRRDRG